MTVTKLDFGIFNWHIKITKKNSILKMYVKNLQPFTLKKI